MLLLVVGQQLAEVGRTDRRFCTATFAVRAVLAVGLPAGADAADRLAAACGALS